VGFVVKLEKFSAVIEPFAAQGAFAVESNPIANSKKEPIQTVSTVEIINLRAKNREKNTIGVIRWNPARIFRVRVLQM
jgi:hypothetical protein